MVEDNVGGWNGYDDTDEGDAWGSPGLAIYDYRRDGQFDEGRKLGEYGREAQHTSGSTVERAGGELSQKAAIEQNETIGRINGSAGNVWVEQQAVTGRSLSKDDSREQDIKGGGTSLVMDCDT